MVEKTRFTCCKCDSEYLADERELCIRCPRCKCSLRRKLGVAIQLEKEGNTSSEVSVNRCIACDEILEPCCGSSFCSECDTRDERKTTEEYAHASQSAPSTSISFFDLRAQQAYMVRVVVALVACFFGLVMIAVAMFLDGHQEHPPEFPSYYDNRSDQQRQMDKLIEMRADRAEREYEAAKREEELDLRVMMELLDRRQNGR